MLNTFCLLFQASRYKEVNASVDIIMLLVINKTVHLSTTNIIEPDMTKPTECELPPHPPPQVKKPSPCSSQLSMKFQLLIKTNIVLG